MAKRQRTLSQSSSSVRRSGAFRRGPTSTIATSVPDIKPQGLGQRIAVDFNVPQTVITFGGPGIHRKDPDFFAAYVVNHILGGGSFSSRLYHEVREKRGLAYSVGILLHAYDHAGLVVDEEDADRFCPGAHRTSGTCMTEKNSPSWRIA